MGRLVKIRCNGPNKHVNEVDIDKAQKVVVVAKIIDITARSSPPPERISLRCRECVGRVIITREMIEDIQKQFG